MKAVYSGFVIGSAVAYPDTKDEPRSVSIWKTGLRKGDISVTVVHCRNTIEKKRLTDFIENFEAHAPHMEDPE